ncbi:MAG TPA: hypothetical protein VFS59_00355 [Gemmatimonadaceae bacterium]|nr:hypothetical protein [Gemmatimonadaceae bacterium]
MRYAWAALFTVAVAAGIAAAPQDPPASATPVPAVDGILDAFATHRIVALPDAHGRERLHAFLLALIRDPRFVRTVDDVLVEFGNSRYQEIADRWVRGEAVPEASLRLVWRNHTQPSLSADFDHYPAVLAAVRAINSAAPGGRRLRVLLGDPPIDWDEVRNREDHARWIAMRDAHPAALLQTEVIAKGRRALVVYGTGHLQRRNVMANFEMEDWRAQTIVSLIERAGPTRIFSVANAPAAHAAGWTPPALARLAGTALGRIDASEIFGGWGRFGVRAEAIVPIDPQHWRTLRAEEQFDAVLYLGQSDHPRREPASRALCDEPGYVAMRLKRIAIAGLPPPETERVRRLCAGGPP